ncbi:MAG TPA: biosynthetic-type acetolactate synthase large subunit [Verrucomicrobiota bacterium]|nr:biosynthetic-type acetolactate synthase large subunit [Verrucomicrobiota bacterium]HNU52275.1 biosynthetic-type acetolactate synthase large subunit [Verrucomicrobiota bacterium]
MSTARKSTAPRKPAADAAASPGLLGSQILVQGLEREGVEVIFAYPGGASMEIHQALTRSKKIRVYLPRHEQGGVFAAEGYARATGKVGVCMATSGPGATNLVTGIADAYMDSVPIVAITGQVAQTMIGKSAFQETDIFGMTLPVVKHSYLVTDIRDLPRIVKEAFHIARSGRPGPVLIDVPKNIQQQRDIPVFPETVTLRGYEPDRRAHDDSIRLILDCLAKAQRPVLYCGGGIITSGAAAALRQFVESTGIPVATTLMGCGAFPETHPLSLKWLGMHGAAYANWAVAEADLLLAFGVRFDDRVTGKVDKFCEHGTLVHVDIDPSELNKNRKVHHAIISDIRHALEQLNAMLAAGASVPSFAPWHQQIAEWKAKAPFQFHVTREVLKSEHVRDHMDGDASQVILPQEAIATLWELTRGEAIITTGVGQHQMWAGQYYHYQHPRQFITSAGLGSMGFGYPAAIGAKVACPNRQVVDIDGDGSFLMNVQELAMAHIEGIAAKAMILNNQHLGMVVQWEDRFYQGNRGHTYIGDPANPKGIYPDFVTIAKAFGVPCERVVFRKDLRAAIQRMLDADQPYVLDILTPYTEHVLPFIPAGKTVREMIWE